MELLGVSEATSDLTREREAWLRLAFVGLPAGRCNAALEKWESPEALLQAARDGRDSELLSTQGVTPTTVERLRDAATRDIQKALNAMSTHGIRVLLRDDEEYPTALRSIPDPPPYLFARGTLETRDEVAVAIVGTRHTTEYGRGLASQFARDLAARGVTVVSGLARGVDTWAHKGALEAGGRTFAVCGCGLDVVYPSENKNLMLDIVNQGAALSEFAPTVHPEAWHFPARNRIISGLSVGVVVIEAGERSGALITSDFAMEQGRDVFAVPGNVHKVQSKGPHALLKQGATLVESADDVLEALNQRALPFETSTRKKAKKAAQRAEAPKVRADLSADENRVYLTLDTEPRHVDDVANAAQMSAAQANALLVMLELKGVAKRAVGGLFSRVS